MPDPIRFSFREVALASEKGVTFAVERPGTRFVFERVAPRGFKPLNDQAENMYGQMTQAAWVHPAIVNPEMMFRAIRAVAEFVQAIGGSAYDSLDARGDQPTRTWPAPYFVIETRSLNQLDLPVL